MPPKRGNWTTESTRSGDENPRRERRSPRASLSWPQGQNHKHTVDDGEEDAFPEGSPTLPVDTFMRRNLRRR